MKKTTLRRTATIGNTSTQYATPSLRRLPPKSVHPPTPIFFFESLIPCDLRIQTRTIWHASRPQLVVTRAVCKVRAPDQAPALGWLIKIGLVTDHVHGGVRTCLVFPMASKETTSKRRHTQK